MNNDMQPSVNNRQLSLQSIAMFCVSFFLVITLLTAFFLIPKINEAFEDVQSKDSQVELIAEAELFTRFVQSQSSLLHDLAKFPNLANAVMLSDASSPDLIDFLDSVVIDGEKSRLVLQDIAGNLLIKTTNNLEGSYVKEQLWMKSILAGSIPYHFMLLAQAGDVFTFKMSVPITYNNSIEGVLSAEITAPLKQIFTAQSHGKNVAYKLEQNSNVVRTNFNHIKIAREKTLELNDLNITFTYITDDAPINEEKRQLRNLILLVLLIGLMISFFLFTIIGYRSVKGDNRNDNSELSFSRNYAIPFLIGLIGFAASIAAYLMIINIQQKSREQGFISDSKVQTQSIVRKIVSNMETLNSLKAFYDASISVERNEFTTLVSPLFSNHEGLQALGWIPNIPTKKISKFEREAINGGLDDFMIHERVSVDEVIPTTKNNTHYPIYYVEPLAVNQRILGLDLATNKSHLSALNLARDTGDRTSTLSFIKHQKKQIKPDILIFEPVFSQTSLYKNKGEREVSNLGFVMLILRPEKLIDDVQRSSSKQLSLFIRDITDQKQPITLYGLQRFHEEFTYQETISFAGRLWLIETTRQGNDGAFSWVSLLVLIMGLFFTASVTYGLIHLIHRRELVEKLVNIRTLELEKLVDKFADSNEELTRFAFVCSHDLQEPLRMIRSFSEKLQLHLERDLINDEKGKRYFHFITDGAARAQSLIADILAYSSIDTDTQNLQSFDSNKLLLAIKENMLANLEVNGGKITSEQLPNLQGNKTQILQLFQNLINNGLKYQKKNTTPHVHISIESSGKYWKFAFKDNGIGMEERHLKKIFDVFQRLNRRSQYAGTGIGLSICRKVVERHGGRIWVESERNIGSTFYFTLLKPTEIKETNE